MTLQKFDGAGNLVDLGDGTVQDGNAVIEVTSLQTSPEEKYVGTWEPGINHPTLPPDADGPYAGIVRYKPIPETQIER